MTTHVLPVNLSLRYKPIRLPTNNFSLCLLQVIRLLFSSGVRQTSVSGEVTQSRLAYENVSGDNIILSSSNDISSLRNMRNVLLELMSEFKTEGSKFTVVGEQKDAFNKRLLLLESEMDGLLKRRVNATTSDATGRTLDYDNFINEKENQVIELEKKIQNLEEKLRVARKRETLLEDEIARLTSAVRAVQNPNITKGELERLTVGAVQFSDLEEKYGRLRAQMVNFAGLFRGQMDKLRSSGVKFEHEAALDQLIRSENLQVSALNGITTVVETREKIVEVPVMESRTKSLIHLLATQMKKNFDKYPKLRDECDSRLFEFFQQEMIDVIEADEMDRIVEIVKYVPDVVKV